MPYETSFARFQAASANVVAAEPTIEFLSTSPPSATSPTEGLPSDPVIGRFYTFASRPATLYTIGPDNVWRAVQLVSVV